MRVRRMRGELPVAPAAPAGFVCAASAYRPRLQIGAQFR